RPERSVAQGRLPDFARHDPRRRDRRYHADPREALARHKTAQPPQPAEDWKRINSHLLIAWVVAWGVGVVAAASGLLGVPLGYALLGVALAFVFVLVNGISLGISDSNPISSAFVVSVTLMALAGLTDPLVALIAGSII